MKILLINKFYYLNGGLERYLFDLERLLQEMGHETVVFSVQDEKNKDSPFREYFVSHVDFFKPHSIFRYPLLAMRALYSFESCKKIEQLIHRTRPDIAHIFNISNYITPSILHTLKRHHIPVVQTLASYEMYCPYGRLFSGKEVCQRCKGKRYFHVLLRRCNRGNFVASAVNCIQSYVYEAMGIYNNVDIIIAPSRYTQQLHKEFGIRGERIVYVPFFVSLRDYTPHYEGGDYIVCFGRLSIEKGLSTLIKAMKGNPDITLYIVGDGSMRTTLQSQVCEMGIHNVRFTGLLSDEELKALVRNALFTVFPSEMYETFGLSIAESFALGKPVIGSRMSAVQELIEDGIDGILFTPGDHRELSEKIKFLAGRTSLVQIMGKKGRQKVEELCQPQTHYERLMRVYTSLISKQKVPMMV